MSALHPYANFALSFLIIVVHILYNDHIHITIGQELKDVALSKLQPVYKQISDFRHFPAMTLEGKLMFLPFPDDPLQWVSWFNQQMQTAQASTLSTKNAEILPLDFLQLGHFSPYCCVGHVPIALDTQPVGSHSLCRPTA